ncbi:MAG: hypothetical protein WC936_06800 [Candidatus Nanoarchaeia archaeon]|jgi:hypothetical protein
MKKITKDEEQFNPNDYLPEGVRAYSVHVMTIETRFIPAGSPSEALFKGVTMSQGLHARELRDEELSITAGAVYDIETGERLIYKDLINPESAQETTEEDSDE